MVNEAEKYKSEDEAQQEKVSARNGLEGYCFSMKQTLEEPNLKDKINDSDRETIKSKIDETLKWLDSNTTAEKEEFEYKQKELEGVCNPIITKLYQGAGGQQPGGMPGGMPGGFPGGMGGKADAGHGQGPTIEEVD